VAVSGSSPHSPAHGPAALVVGILLGIRPAASRGGGRVLPPESMPMDRTTQRIMAPAIFSCRLPVGRQATKPRSPLSENLHRHAVSGIEALGHDRASRELHNIAQVTGQTAAGRALPEPRVPRGALASVRPASAIGYRAGHWSGTIVRSPNA